MPMANREDIEHRICKVAIYKVEYNVDREYNIEYTTKNIDL